MYGTSDIFDRIQVRGSGKNVVSGNRAKLGILRVASPFFPVLIQFPLFFSLETFFLSLLLDYKVYPKKLIFVSVNNMKQYPG
jgi:hypothetical protein